MLRSGLLRYILHTCPKLWCNPCSKCYAVDCFGTYFTHVQSCDVTRVQSATQWAASVYRLHPPPKLWCNTCAKCYRMGFLAAYFTHVQSCDLTRVQSATNGLLRYKPQTCAKLWFNPCSNQVLRSGLLWCMLHTWPRLWCNPCSKWYGMGCSAANFTHAQSCDVTRVQSAAEWAA